VISDGGIRPLTSLSWAAAPLVAVLLAPGCASALKPPPSLDALVAGDASGPESVDGLLQEARIEYASRIRENVRRARNLWLQAAAADGSRIEGLLGAARSSAWLADHEEDKAMRLEAAQVAVQSGQLCAQAVPGDPACAYWLGVGLGLQAMERRSTALDALPRIEKAFLRAAADAPEMEQGGADRALTMLYARAPGWPTGPGDPDLALEHARKAVAIDGTYPPNLLALGEALAATGDDGGSRATYEEALTLARQWSARGDPDAPDWIRDAESALAGSD